MARYRSCPAVSQICGACRKFGATKPNTASHVASWTGRPPAGASSSSVGSLKCVPLRAVLQTWHFTRSSPMTSCLVANSTPAGRGRAGHRWAAGCPAFFADHGSETGIWQENSGGFPCTRPDRAGFVPNSQALLHLRTNCGLAVGHKLVPGEAREAVGLAHTAVANQHHLHMSVDAKRLELGKTMNMRRASRYTLGSLSLDRW